MRLLCFLGVHRWRFYQCAAHAASETGGMVAVVIGLCVCGWACRECGMDR